MGCQRRYSHEHRLQHGSNTIDNILHSGNTYNVGHFNSPNQDVLALKPPGYMVMKRKRIGASWRKPGRLKNIPLPVNVAPGAVVRVETFLLRDEDNVACNVVKLRGEFNHDESERHWHLPEGLKTRFYIECDSGKVSNNFQRETEGQ